MTNLFKSQNLSSDYKNFETALFASKANKYGLTADLKPQLKKYHTFTYIIALFAHKLQEKWTNDFHKFLFISEIRSDLLSNSEISILGYYNSSKILTRRFIENFFNHIYFFDHPVEYELLNQGKNEYTPLLELKQYFLNHPVIKLQISSDPSIKSYADNLINNYHDLCKHVHTKGIDFMDLATNLTETKPQINIANHFESANDSASNIIYLLFKFHQDLIFTAVERSIIYRSFTKDVRRNLTV
jgi:hypothetical protein